MPNACLLTELEYLSYKRSKYQDSKGPHTLGPCKQQRPCHVGVSGEKGRALSPFSHGVQYSIYKCVHISHCWSMVSDAVHLSSLVTSEQKYKIQSITPPQKVTVRTIARSSKNIET